MVAKIHGLILVLTLFLSSQAFGLTMDMVSIGNAGNSADDTGYGTVNYDYSIGKYEVTYGQYIEFLNAIAKTDTYGVYKSKMNTNGGIKQSGTSGNYTYTWKSGWQYKPINFNSWFDALRFANWMHNGQPTGLQDQYSTEDGAYDMALGINVVRKEDALYALPTKNEFYKAAYFDPLNNVYYDYAMGSDATPTEPNPPGSSSSSNYANFWEPNSPSNFSTYNVGSFSHSPSPYGTFDQNGNVWEWSDQLNGSQVYLWGGAASSSVTLLSSATYGDSLDPNTLWSSNGFRLVTDFSLPLTADQIPEPATLILFGSTMVSIVLRRKTK